MDTKKAQKITYIVNTVILILVFGLMGFFYMCHATFLVYFSIPTAFVYIIGFYLIYSEKLDFYVRIVYLWLTLYMCTTTLCLGYNFGFHLYCMSMIPVIFVTVDPFASFLFRYQKSASILPFVPRYESMPSILALLEYCHLL